MPGSFVIPQAVKRKWFTAPDGWDDVWRAQMAASGSQQARWGIMGDSNSSGFDSAIAGNQSAVNWWTRRWSTQLAAKMEARSPGGRSGEFFQPNLTNNTYFSGAPHHPDPAWLTPPSAVGTTSFIGFAGGFQLTFACTGASGVGWAWRFDSSHVGAGYPFTDWDLLNVDLNGGTFHYRVDSSGDNTITTANTSAAPTTVYGFGPGRVVRRQFTGLSNASHQIDFGNTSGVQALQLAGINAYPSNAARSQGVFTANYSVPGYDMASIAVNNGSQYMQPESWSGLNGLLTITGITNAVPSVVTSAAHGLSTGAVIRIAGATTAASNGEYKVLSSTTNTLNLDNTVVPGGTSSAGFITIMSPQLGPPTAPHLLVIMNYGNDMQQGRGLDATYEATRRLVMAARRAVDQCAILFVIHDIPDPRISENTFALDNIQNWYQYMDLEVTMATSFGAGLYNLGADIGMFGVTKGYIPRNDVHLTDAGHTYLANQLAPFLVP